MQNCFIIYLLDSAAIESNSLDPNKLSYAIGAHRTKIKGHGQLFGADYVDMNMNYGAQKGYIETIIWHLKGQGVGEVGSKRNLLIDY